MDVVNLLKSSILIAVSLVLLFDIFVSEEVLVFLLSVMTIIIV
jgi:hypothetical protein